MKQRLMTAAVGIAFVLVWFGLRDTVAFNAIMSIAIGLAVYEALKSTKIVTSRPLLWVCMAYAIAVPFFELVRFYPIGIAISLLFLFAMLIIVLVGHETIDLRQASYSFMISTLVPFSISSILYINALSKFNQKYDSLDGFFYVLLAMLGAWIADSGAFFVGKAFGKHKLAPTISPKKTVEGAVGGIISVIVVDFCVAIFWQMCILKNTAHINFIYLGLLAVVTAVAGIIGDLTFSYIKRETGIKDFGNIMPGHGGMLDRIDSLTLSAPITLFFVIFMPVLVR